MQYFARGVEKDKAKPYKYHGTTRIPEVTHDKSDNIPHVETKLVQQTRAEKKTPGTAAKTRKSTKTKGQLKSQREIKHCHLVRTRKQANTR